MDYMKTLAIILLLAVLAMAGCISSSGENAATTPPKIVATVGAPTPIPTEPPEPTQGPTWVPTPTPVPPKVTLSNFNLTVTINGDQRQWTGDPNQSGQINAQYATRQDTVTFNVMNTGDATLEGLEIIYQVVTPITVIGPDGVSYTTDSAQIKKESIGSFKPGDSRNIAIASPLYGAMLEANVTVTAKWKGGSLDLYMTTLEPNFQSGTIYSPENDMAVKTHGSAYN